MLVMISKMFVHICNRFYARRANSGKIKLLRGYPSFTLSFEWNPSLPLTQGHGITSQKIRGKINGKDVVILAFTVLIGLQSVTDTRTTGQTDGRLGLAKTREAFCCRA